MRKKIFIAFGAVLFGIVAADAAENRVILNPGSEGTDKWFGTYYNKEGVDNDILRVGGWGDYYYTLIKFDGATQNLPGSFKRAELWFYRVNVTRPTNIRTWILSSSWSEALWDHSNLMGYYIGDYPGPAIGSGWYGLDVTSSVTFWRQNPSRNYGWFFGPASNDNRYNTFYASDATTSSLRPQLHLVYDESETALSQYKFKMPLLGGKAWKLTVEAGGKAYDGMDDVFHTGRTYYSLDFSPYNKQINGDGSVQNDSDAPILAVKEGYVYKVGNNPLIDPFTLNGYFVKIDHDGDGNLDTGFQTVYCHFKYPPLVQTGQTVVQGQKLGIMGMSGTKNTGIHLHITFYHKDFAIGNGTDPQLDQIRMEERAIKDYKLNSSNPATPIFYPSSNVMR